MTARRAGDRVRRAVVVAGAAARRSGPARTAWEEEGDTLVFLDQVADSFGPAARTAGVELGTDADPRATVEADPARLRQAVANLVANALRHTPRGGRVTLRGSPGTLEVTDTGEGIPAADLPYVFDRFRRVDASRNRATGGSGLGLAIVRQIVEAHGGSASAASTAGSGTTVTLRLPNQASGPAATPRIPS